jgi:hypothetical protein
MDGLVAALNQPPPPFAVDSSTQNFMLSMMGRYMGLGASRETKAPEIPKVQYASLVDVLTAANVTPERLETILATLTSNGFESVADFVLCASTDLAELKCFTIRDRVALMRVFGSVL